MPVFVSSLLISLRVLSRLTRQEVDSLQDFQFVDTDKWQQKRCTVDLHALTQLTQGLAVTTIKIPVLATCK